MSYATAKPHRFSPSAWMLVFVGLLAGSSGSAHALTAIKWRQKAQNFEKKGAWGEACRAYDEALRKDRNHTATREGYLRCLRRLHLASRHQDAAYRQLLSRLTATQSLDLYEQILNVIVNCYPDRNKVALGDLFRHGIQELRFALDDPNFQKTYLNGVRPATLAVFKGHLITWPNRKIASRTDAREQVFAVARMAAKDGIPLRAPVLNALVLEFAAGACNTLDEYSTFLTPGYYHLTQAAHRGKIVGTGMELGSSNEELVVSRVYPKGPADLAGLKKQDRVLRINGQLVKDLHADVAAAKLRGEPNSIVSVEVIRGNDATKGKKTFKITRKAFTIPSAEFETVDLGDAGKAGYLRIGYFADSTAQEIRDAFAANSDFESMKAMILDLRGNPGGLFKSAITVAGMFLDGEVVVVGQSRYKDLNKPIKAESGGFLQMPVMVLIDGETASAAEVLAGALKDSRRASTTIIGQTSYGKGSIQCLITMDKAPLDKLHAGMRLTVAKLFSPTNQPYTGRGITPDFVVDLEGDALIEDAKKRLTTLLKPQVAQVEMD